jgi:putative ABC transport system permease protein
MHFSRLIRTVQLGLKSLMLHKLRSGLAMLGIVFGVFSVIAMLAIGEGASQQALKQVVALGATNIIARSVKPLEEASGGSSGGGRMSGMSVPRYGLLRADLNRIQKTIPTIRRAIPIREIPKEARYLKRTVVGRMVGCTADYVDINHLRLASGRFVSDADDDALASVVVIAAGVADALFPGEDPLGKSIQIGNIYFRVIGVTAERTSSAAIGGSLSGQDFNKDFYIPIGTLRVRVGDLVFTQKSGTFESEYVELNQITMSVASVDDVIPTSDLVRVTLEKFHPKKDVDVIVPLELLRQADQMKQIFNIVLGSIAAISLVVGGIGIMNIMLATVTERTREIGVRRALGATQRDIIEQFLTETVVLSGTGGLLGVGLGLLTPLAFEGLREVVVQVVLGGNAGGVSDTARIFQDMRPVVAFWSMPLAFGISVAIGVVFGIYPARNAARLDPIEALRHQ